MANAPRAQNERRVLQLSQIISLSVVLGACGGRTGLVPEQENAALTTSGREDGGSPPTQGGSGGQETTNGSTGPGVTCESLLFDSFEDTEEGMVEPEVKWYVREQIEGSASLELVPVADPLPTGTGHLLSQEAAPIGGRALEVFTHVHWPLPNFKSLSFRAANARGASAQIGVAINSSLDNQAPSLGEGGPYEVEVTEKSREYFIPKEFIVPPDNDSGEMRADLLSGFSIHFFLEPGQDLELLLDDIAFDCVQF